MPDSISEYPGVNLRSTTKRPGYVLSMLQYDHYSRPFHIFTVKIVLCTRKWIFYFAETNLGIGKGPGDLPNNTFSLSRGLGPLS